MRLTVLAPPRGTPLLRVAFVLALGLLAVSAPRAGAQAPAAPTLAVEGVGIVRLAPDEAQFVVMVQRTAATAAQARAAVRTRVDRAVRALVALGVERGAVRTEYAQLTRERVRTGRPRRVRVRFRAETALAVRTDQVRRLGPLFDAVTGAGADVSGPDFTFADPSAGRAQAARAALADARRRADDAAAQLGLRVGSVLAVDLDPQEGDSFPTAGSGGGQGGSDDAEGGTRILPGVREVIARVRVTYALATRSAP